MIPPDHNDEPVAKEYRSSMKTVRLKGNITIWCISGVGISLLGLLLTSGLSTSIWMFLLLPVFIVTLLISLGGLALQLIRYF